MPSPRRARRWRSSSDNSYPIIVSDIYVDEKTGLDVLETAKQKNPDCAVILMTGRGTMETVMRATQGGAFEYIAKPFELDQMLDVVEAGGKPGHRRAGKGSRHRGVSRRPR